MIIIRYLTMKDFSRAVYWEIVKFPSNQLLSVAFTSRRLVLFLTFECVAAKILNYRFQLSRHPRGHTFDRYSCEDRSCSRYAIRSSRFRLVRVNELHENWATSFRDSVAFFFLMTTRCNLQALHIAACRSWVITTYLNFSRAFVFFPFPHSSSRKKKKTAVVFRAHPFSFVSLYYTRF